MWSTILLYVRRLFVRNKIKKETKGATVKQAKKILKAARGPIQDSNKRGKIKKLKKLVFKDKTLTWSLRVNLLIALITVIVTIMVVSSVIMLIANLAGWSILSNREEEATKEEEEYGWVWDLNDEVANDEVELSGGIYPKDPIIKNRALLLKIIEQSAKDVQAEKGTLLYPEYLLGVIIRETGGYKILNLMDKNNDTSWLTSLSYSVPVCEKGSNCSYVKAGYSHFIGGSVVNGVDTGDPYTMKINGDKSIYDATGGDHALGFVQFEIPYIEGRMTRSFPISTLGISDSDINFIRPNFFYIPDQLYSMAFLIGGYSMNSSNYHTIVDSADFKSLDERNQTFVMFMMQQGYYAGGGVKDSYITAFNELMSAYKSGKIEHFDEMLMVYKDKFYDTTTHSMKNFDVAGCKQYIKDTYGVYATSFKSTAWYGIYAACAGRAAWEAINEEIDAAEKETTGNINISGTNYLNGIGSGKFANPTNSEYYSPSLQAVWFAQGTRGGTNVFGYTLPAYTTTIQNKKYYGSGTYLTWGCPAYSMAMLLSNIMGTVIMPDALPGTTTAVAPWSKGTRNVSVSGYGFTSGENTITSVNGTLSSTGAGYQLKYKLLSVNQLKSCESHLYEWLDRGAMLWVRVIRYNSQYPTTGNHFVTIVGYDKTSKVGNNYDLIILNSIRGNKTYTLIDMNDGQGASAEKLNSGGGLHYYLRNYNTYCCMVVWRTDVAESLPGL